MRLVAVAIAFALAARAAAEDPDAAPAVHPDAEAAAAAGLPLPAPSPAEEAAAEKARSARAFPKLGLLLDAGFPAGAAASVVYRPVAQIRLHAGPAWSVVAWGAQAGVTVVPWHLGLSPLLSLEAGRSFANDASFLARNSSGIPEELEPLLHDLTYDYAALHVGFELGTRDAFALSVRVGLARVWFDAHGTTTVSDGAGGTGATVTFTDPRVRGTMPSVKLGLQLWF